MKTKYLLISIILLSTSILHAKIIYVSAKAEGEPLPAWSPGYLDIHHINTGCGNATFCILPDGTTLLIDAGANNPNSERHVAPRPNNSKAPGEWIANYILHFFPENKTKQIDYFLATHFDKDHIGGVLNKKSSKADYYLTGISEVAEYIPIAKIIDRDYPSYNIVRPGTDETQFYNYLNFTEYEKILNPNIMSRFEVGVNNQFALKYDTNGIYNGKFEIRNLIANGIMWTGTGTEIRNLFPDISQLTGSDIPEENSLSCGIKLSYGKFDWFAGGDLTGFPKPGRPAWHDLETPLAPVVGKVEVCEVNHHGYAFSTNDFFVKTLAPRVFIIQASDALHPCHSTLYRLLSKQLYPDARDIFSTNMHPAAKIVIGDLVEQMKSIQGHIVVRVSPGGSDFMVYILDDSDTSYTVNASFGPYFCN